MKRVASRGMRVERRRDRGGVESRVNKTCMRQSSLCVHLTLICMFILLQLLHVSWSIRPGLPLVHMRVLVSRVHISARASPYVRVFTCARRPQITRLHPAMSCYKPGRLAAPTHTYIRLYIGQRSPSMLTAAAEPRSFLYTSFNHRRHD